MASKHIHTLNLMSICLVRNEITEFGFTNEKDEKTRKKTVMYKMVRDKNQFGQNNLI